MITGVAFSKFVGEVVVTAEGETCFYCGRPTSDPAIVWSGFTGEVFLHPQCVAEISIRIIRDLHEVECKTHSGLVFANDGEKTR